jgi:5'-phosphate synthase pdxT subunit
MNIGILALQGNYYKHKKVLDVLGIKNTLIRNAQQLDKCDSLIIPGGESTTMSKLIDNNKLRNILIDFAMINPILGTCAGMIMLSTTMPTDNMVPLNIMDFQIKRNAWGRQVHSFSEDIYLDFDKDKSFHAVFIRAPKISRIGEGLQVLSTYNDEPILVSDGMHIVSVFHPEIGNDFRIHEYFINHIDERIPSLS